MSDLKIPKPASLRRYGITQDEWLSQLSKQGGVCAVCQRIPPSGRMVTDHEHVKGWKKMPPEERRKYVRGVICSFCNYRRVGRGMNLDIARLIVAYFEAYAARSQEWMPR